MSDLSKPPQTGGSTSFVNLDALIRRVAPLALYTTIAVQVFLLPSLYGTMYLSNEFPCVLLTLRQNDGPQPPGASYLLSDLSVAKSEVVVLSIDEAGAYSHYFYDRGAIQEIVVVEDCGRKNILHIPLESNTDDPT